MLPTNYEVLQRELPILDVMTRNRDSRIWAVARGAPRVAIQVDDTDTPPFTDARAKGRDESLFMTGAESDASTKRAVPESRAVRLGGDVPRSREPGADGFDTKAGYGGDGELSALEAEEPMDDKLLILEDTDGDGRADKRTVFAGDLNNPTGIEF